MDIETNKPEYWQEGIQEAGLELAYRWDLLNRASDPVSAASAMVKVSEAMGDFITYLPGWNVDLGNIDWNALEELTW